MLWRRGWHPNSMFSVKLLALCYRVMHTPVLWHQKAVFCRFNTGNLCFLWNCSEVCSRKHKCLPSWTELLQSRQIDVKVRFSVVISCQWLHGWSVASKDCCWSRGGIVIECWPKCLSLLSAVSDKMFTLTFVHQCYSVLTTSILWTKDRLEWQRHMMDVVQVRQCFKKATYYYFSVSVADW